MELNVATGGETSEHERLVAALKASRAGTWRWDIPADRVEWDEALSAVYGLPHAEAPRTSAAFLQLIHPDDRERAGQLLGALLESGSEIEYEFRAVVGDRIVRVYDRSTLVRDVDGRPAYMTGACLDVTARKRIEEERALEPVRTFFKPADGVEIGCRVFCDCHRVVWIQIEAAPKLKATLLRVPFPGAFNHRERAIRFTERPLNLDDLAGVVEPLAGPADGQVNADAVMLLVIDSQFQLGADAVGRRDQDRIAEARRLEVEQAAEAAQAAHDAFAVGGFGHRLDGLDQRVARVDIDACVPVGASANGFLAFG